MAETFCKWVDTINEWSGKIVAWLFIPFTLLVTTDVFTRYVLNKPWYYLDINVQIMSTIILLGAGYNLLHNKHIEMDLLVDRLSRKKRARLNLVLYPLIIFALGVLLWKITIAAADSIRVLEKYTSGFGPPIYPLKTIVAIGVLLFLLESIAKYIRIVKTAFGPEPAPYTTVESLTEEG